MLVVGVESRPAYIYIFIYTTHARAIHHTDPARSLARSTASLPLFSHSYPAPRLSSSQLLGSIRSPRPLMYSTEVTPILRKHSLPLSVSSPRPFFLAYLPRVLAWCLAGFILVTWSNWVGVYAPARQQPPNTQPFVLPNYISHNLGAYSPWYPVQRYKSPPKECEVTQVSRQPDSDDTRFAVVSSSSPSLSLF